MYVVNEKAFLYSVLLSLKVPTKRELIQTLKKEGLRYDPDYIDRLMGKIKNNPGRHATTFMITDPGITLIVFYTWREDAFNYGVLTHELFHAVDMNLRSKGITLSDDSDEVYAYHLGYFTREFLNQIWDKNRF